MVKVEISWDVVVGNFFCFPEHMGSSHREPYTSDSFIPLLFNLTKFGFFR
jgi:hypothetical protein